MFRVTFLYTMVANNTVVIKTHTTQATHARDDTKLCIDVAFLTAIVENGGDVSRQTTAEKTTLCSFHASEIIDCLVW